MKDYRILSITLSAVIALSCMPLCMGNGKEQIPEEAVIITQAEADQINSLKADGKDDMEIAEILSGKSETDQDKKSTPPVKAATPDPVVPVISSYKWIKKSGKWYCKKSDGSYAKGFAKIGSQVYYFDTKGIMKTGWISYEGSWFYFAGSGAMKTGWQKISKKWYYFEDTGIMVTGVKEIGTDIYVFGDSGAMATGWKYEGGVWFYLKSSGAAKRSEWMQSAKTWYYFDQNGVMVTGHQEIEGNYYFFLDSGAMATGWIEYEGEWYYFNDSGDAVFGWTEVDGREYCFDEYGMMLHDTTVDGYKLDSEGRIIYEYEDQDDEDEEEYDTDDEDTTYTFKESTEDEMVDLINNLRKVYAVEQHELFYVPIRIKESLRERAHIRCLEITEDFSHDSVSDNSGWGECILRSGNTSSSAKSLVSLWEHSPRHKAWLMKGVLAEHKSVIYCGIGVLEYKGQTYGVFGTSGSEKGEGLSSGYDGPTNTPTPIPFEEGEINIAIEGLGGVRRKYSDTEVILMAEPNNDDYVFSHWNDRYGNWYSDVNPLVLDRSSGGAYCAVFEYVGQ